MRFAYLNCYGPFSDEKASVFGWRDTHPLPTAPQANSLQLSALGSPTVVDAVEPKRVQLSGFDNPRILDVLELLSVTNTFFGGVVNFNARLACKELLQLAKVRPGLLFMEIDLVVMHGDSYGVSHARVLLAKQALEAWPGIAVTKLNAFHGSLCDDFKGRGMSKRVWDAWRFVHETVTKNRACIKYFGYCFREPPNSDAPELCYGKIEGPFPRLEELKVDNTACYTGEMLAMLRGMPGLEKVQIVGNLDQYGSDKWYDKAERTDRDDMKNVAVVLPESVQVLLLDQWNLTNGYRRWRFMQDFAKEAREGRFGRLKTVSMRWSFATLKKDEGADLIDALRHCGSLREFVISENERMKRWHYQALERLGKARGDVRVVKHCVSWSWP